jgi:hypothetical protein
VKRSDKSVPPQWFSRLIKFQVLLKAISQSRIALSFGKLNCFGSAEMTFSV